MKLRSVYSEVEGEPGSRGARGEPVVTTFHRMFKGTVDYIWRSEDLRTVRVLDTPPASVLLRDKEMPSKRWASDHLALACELSFVLRSD
jgi:mRNA deadenylase 3'-5' endonuclease subunit Ccr4